MAEGFEISVPITLKGGREGEKVGKQIGEKIAAQIQKSFRAIGFGKTTGGGGVGEAAGMLGMSKGLKGIATKLGVVGVLLTAILGVLSQASPYLRGILSIFGRAFMIFFRPFGDFLATLLRPLAILLLKLATGWLKLTRPITGKVREAMDEVPQFGYVDNALADFAIGIANWALKIGAAIGTVALEIGKAAFQLGGQIGQWLYDEVIKPAGDWIADKLFGIWKWANDFAGWVWEKITSIWIWAKDFPGWIWGKITTVWSWTKDFAEWIWGKITGIWNYTKDFASWLWDEITSAFSNIWDKLSGVGTYLYNRITESIKDAFSKFTFGWSWWWQKGQVGIPNVPHEGLYYLHKGEEVVPKTRVGQGKSITLNPTFQFSGMISKEADMDSLVRRASRMTEMELKKRGII